MDEQPVRKRVDPAIVQELLDLVENGIQPSLKELTIRHPGREQEVRAALRAVDRYRKRLREARFAVRADTDGGLDVLPPGTRLGEFTIEGVLGRGAMGVVYRARQQSLGRRQVALKVLPPALVARDPRFRERFRREAELASTVHHPHVAAVYGFGTEGETLFFAMQLVEGRTLHATLSGLALKQRLGHGRMHQKSYLLRAVRVVREVADALAAIHARNLVHRDVKPANILLEYPEAPDLAGTEDLGGRAVLVDFGLLRPVGPTDLTGTRTLLGTPAFASPESQLGRDVDARADVFSLGVILHDLLTVTPPEARKSASAGLPDVCALNPVVDARLAAVVVRAIEERPAIRYADGAAFRDDLDRYLRNEPVRALPATPVGKVRLWARRNPVRAVKSGVAGFMLLALLLAGGWFGHQVIQLYTAASRGARHESQGDLRAAAADHQNFLEHPVLTRILPGIGSARLRRARDYHDEDGRLSRILGWLITPTEEAHASAHREILSRLLHADQGDPGDRDLRELLARFLAGEIRRGPEIWKRRLAAETAAYWLLFQSRPYHRAWPPDSWERFLNQALLGVLAEGGVRAVPDEVRSEGVAADGGRDDESDRLRLYAVSALSGLPSIGGLQALHPAIRSGTPELSRLALEACFRIWWAMHEGGALQDITPEVVDSWVRATRERVQRIQGDIVIGTPIADFVASAVGALPYHVAWSWRETGYDPASRPARDGDDWIGFITQLRDALDVCAGGNNPQPVKPAIPEFARFAWYEKTLCPKPREFFDHFNLEVNPDFVCENVWIPGIGDDEKGTHHGPGRAGSATAGFGFTTREPTLQGAAASVAWTGARLEKTCDSPRAGHVLKLTHSGMSGLTLRSEVPGWAATARVAVSQCRASRKILPYQGQARIRISILDSRVEIVNENLHAGKKPPFEFLVDERSLRRHRAGLGLHIHLDRASTTYWIYDVTITFQKKK